MKQRLSGYDHRLVRRIAAIINCIGGCESPTRLVDIAEHTGLDSATTYRILSELVREGYVHKNESTRCYTPGLQICQLGGSEYARSSAVESLQPWLAQIEQLTGVPAILGSRKGTTVQLHHRPSALARHPGAVEALRVGFVDAHATAVGKALLAVAKPAEVKALYSSATLQRHTPKTIGSLQALYQEVQGIRRIGHAVEAGEYFVGLHGIGVVVPAQIGEPTFAVWLTSSAEQLKRLTVEPILEQTKAILAKAVNPGSEH